MEANRPARERELAAVEAQVRKAQGSLDRYFQALEEGRLREEVCTRRIEELSAELASLEARRSELAEEISESQPGVPGPAELVEFVGDIERGLSDGALPERKAVMQAVVAEIRVRDRGHIQPVFRVPIFGPPYGSVHPTEQKSKKCPQVDGHVLSLSTRHAKLRREGYRKPERQ